MGAVSGRTPDAGSIRQAEILEAKELAIAETETAQQTEQAEDLLATQDSTVNPLSSSFSQAQKALKEQRLSPPSKAEQKEQAKKVLVKEDAEKQAFLFEKEHPEMKKEVLSLLLKQAVACKDKDELLKLLSQFYPDPMLADEALDYLLLVAQGPFKEIVEQTKTALGELHGKEITAGKNISAEVQEYSRLGLGEPTKLRTLYQDITGTQREPLALFVELMDRYKYKEMRTVLAYLFHAIGADLKMGPSIQPGLLNALLKEVRSLQAGLGMQKFFMKRMKLLEFLFAKNGLPLPPELTFESLTRQFISLLQERYPSPDKVLQLAQKLGIGKETLAKIYTLCQMRDGVREIALHIFYKSVQHRDEVYTSILDALETLEEQYDSEVSEDEQEDTESDIPQDQTKKEEAALEEKPVSSEEKIAQTDLPREPIAVES